MSEVTFVTLVDWRPDFIEPQYESLKKNCLDEFKYIVINNSFDKKRRESISKICKRLGIREIRVKRRLSLAFKGGKNAFKLVDWSGKRSLNKASPKYGMNDGKSGIQVFGKKVIFFPYKNVTVACSYGMNFISKFVYPKIKSDFFVVIDSDMFFWTPIKIDKFMEKYDMAFTPQYRGYKGQVYYSTNGFVIVKKSSKVDFQKLNWAHGIVNGFPTDVGGAGTKWLARKIESGLRIRHMHTLSFLTIQNNAESSYSRKVDITIDGTWHTTIQLDNQNKIISSIENPSNDFIETFFPELENSTDSSSSFNSKLELAIKQLMLVIDPKEWPEPIYIEFLPFEFDLGFVFHYKSGSNYQAFATDDYNKLKTKALNKLIF